MVKDREDRNVKSRKTINKETKMEKNETKMGKAKKKCISHFFS